MWEERWYSSGSNSFRNSQRSLQYISLLWVCPFPLFLQSFKKFLSRQYQLGFSIFMIKRYQHVFHLLKIKERKMNIPPDSCLMRPLGKVGKREGWKGWQCPEESHLLTQRCLLSEVCIMQKPGENGQQWPCGRTRALTWFRLPSFYLTPYRKVRMLILTNCPSRKKYFKARIL